METTNFDTLSRFQYEDILEESLEKATALTWVFGSAIMEDYDEETLQWFFVAILENMRKANHTWKILKDLKQQA